MDTFNFTIPQKYLFNVQKKLAVLNKKIVKRGAPPFVLTKGKESIKFISPLDNKEKIAVPAIEIEITGEPFAVDGGYLLRGLFQRGQDGEPNQFKSFGDFKFSPEQQNCGDNCDCCKKKRNRNNIFFVEPKENDELSKKDVLQIGGDCVEIYLGVTAATAATTIGIYEEAWNILKEEESAGWEDEYDGFGKHSTSYRLDEFLPVVASCIRRNGWVSKSRASEELLLATSDDAVLFLKDTPFEKQKEYITQADVDCTNQAIRHFKEQFPLDSDVELSDFELNIKQIVHSDKIGQKMLGKSAWIIQGYKKFLEQQDNKRRMGLSQHQGQAGQKITGHLMVDRLIFFDSMYGRSYIVSMSDKDENIYVWKTGSPGSDIQEGAVINFTAKIKEHGIYKETAQTVLSHLKVNAVVESLPDTAISEVEVKKKKPARSMASL